MLDVDEARRIAVNEAYRTVAFTWNAIRHLLLVPEDQIVRPEPSILLPKSHQQHNDDAEPVRFAGPRSR